MITVQAICEGGVEACSRWAAECREDGDLAGAELWETRTARWRVLLSDAQSGPHFPRGYKPLEARS